MKQGWEYKKLGEVCEKITDGSHFSPKEANGGKYPMLSVKDMDVAGFIYDNCKYINEVEYKNLVANGCKPLVNDVLVAKDGSYLKTAFVQTEDKDQAILSSIAIIRPNQDVLLSPYVAAYFRTPQVKSIVEKHYLTGTAIKRIILKGFRNISIPLPPLSTQQSIVAELDEINNLLNLKRKELETYDKLAQSVFYEMFGDPVENEKGWEVKKLGEISSLICNGNTPKGGSEVYVESGILFLRSQNVWKNRIELDDVAYIDEATHQCLKKSSLKHHDLLITKTGRINTENSSLGRTALFEGDDDCANINGHVYLVRLKEGMVHKFVLYILISKSYRELIRKTCVGGIDKRQLNKDHIEDFPILFPPIGMQVKYVERVELIEKQKAQVKAAIEKLETLLAARMQYWFE